jgi:hypothetical protein
MDVALITGAYNGLKFAKDALNAALTCKIENETRRQISAALDKLGSAQHALFELRKDLFRLQSENEQLRQQVKARDEWEIQRSRYQLAETAGGAIVYLFTETPRHYACPSCFSRSTVQILQDRRVMAGVFDCPGCRTVYPINPRENL